MTIDIQKTQLIVIKDNTGKVLLSFIPAMMEKATTKDKKIIVTIQST